MRRLLVLAGLVAGTLPVGLPAAHAVGTCSIQANHTDIQPVVFTAAVNCTGATLDFCQANAVVVHQTGVRSDPVQTTQGPGQCLSAYSTPAKTDTLPLTGSRHIEAKFHFVVSGGGPVSLTYGGDTVPSSLTCILGGSLYTCFADSTTYSY